VADYVSPVGQVLPFVDLPATSTPVTAAWLNAVEAMAEDVAGASGRVASLEANGVRAVIVSTGNETRPTAAVVLWVSPGGVAPVHAAAADLVFTATALTNSVAPTISGTAVVGQTLTAGNGTWSATPDSYTYVWRRSTVAISGATSSTYQLVTGDIGATITVTVTAVKAGYVSAAATSSATATVTGSTQLFADTFNRADGAVANSWAFVASGTGTIASNACTFAGWGGYATGAYRTGMPKAASVRAVYTSTVQTFQGIFLAHSGTTGTGIRLLNTGGTWVVGDSASFGAHDATISAGGIPASPWLSLRLDFDGTTITAYINGTLVHTTTPGTLGITLDTDTGSVYRCGVVGEPGHAALDSFEVWTA
jgi:hypothetical protein